MIQAIFKPVDVIYFVFVRLWWELCRLAGQLVPSAGTTTATADNLRPASVLTAVLVPSTDASECHPCRHPESRHRPIPSACVMIYAPIPEWTGRL